MDVVELSGAHIRKFYSEMGARFERFLVSHRDEALSPDIRPGVPAATAVMLVSRFFLHYWAVEMLFGVPNQFGRESELVVREVADILRHGIVKAGATAAPARPVLAPARR